MSNTSRMRLKRSSLISPSVLPGCAVLGWARSSAGVFAPGPRASVLAISAANSFTSGQPATGGLSQRNSIIAATPRAGSV